MEILLNMVTEMSSAVVITSANDCFNGGEVISLSNGPFHCNAVNFIPSEAIRINGEVSRPRTPLLRTKSEINSVSNEKRKEE